MIENYTPTTANNTQQTQRVLTYVKNERMGGFVPKYEIVEKSDSNIAQNIESSLIGGQASDTLNAYSPQGQTLQAEEQFTFGDLIDMVNPLHHIPVVGHLYREVTGDEIKSSSKIIGGAAFGGPMGAASALIDTVVKEETGKDMSTHAIDIAFNNDTFDDFITADTPEIAIENALERINEDDMASALLSFSDLGKPDDALLKYEAAQRVEEKIQEPVKREPISQVSFSEKSGLYAL